MLNKLLVRCFTLLVTIFISNCTYAMDSLELVSLRDRCEVFKKYYLENPENNDPSVFLHMRNWHKGDAASVETTLKQETNKQNLAIVRQALEESFEQQTVTFTKIAAGYILYSALLTHELLPGENSSEQMDRACINTGEYIRTEKFDKIRNLHSENSGKSLDSEGLNQLLKMQAVLDQEGQWPGYEGLNRLVHVEKMNVRWLPFVSKSGWASLRTLNTLCGMRAAIIGVPLGMSSYDGNYPADPLAFSLHDTNHGGLFDGGNGLRDQIGYVYYRQANDIVCRIKDNQTQVLCDFFLFHLGHEQNFAVSPTSAMYSFERTTAEEVSLEEVCDATLKQNLGSFSRFNIPLPLDYYWNYLTRRSVEGSPIGPSQSHDEYYTTTSKLVSFVNKDTGNLFTLVEIINQHQLSKSNELLQNDITAPFIILSSKLAPNKGSHAECELWNWVSYDLGLRFYNQLLGWQKFINNAGYPFELWEGDKLNTAGFEAFFKLSCETFKREVAPHFKTKILISASTLY